MSLKIGTSVRDKILYSRKETLCSIIQHSNEIRGWWYSPNCPSNIEIYRRKLHNRREVQFYPKSYTYTHKVYYSICQECEDVGSKH